MGQTVFETPEHLRQFFFAMLESLPGGILLADRQGNMLAANGRAAALLGIAGSPLQSRTCWDLLRRLTGPDADIASLRVSGGRLLCELAASGPDAEKRYILVSRNDLQSPFLEVAGFFLSLDDVTMPAMLGMHVDRSRRFAAMRDMAEAMSQELKNPLGSLELYASILKRELAEDPDNERIASRMLGAVRTMHHLLDNFVTFSGAPQPRMEELHLAKALANSLETLRELAEERGIFMETRMEAGQAKIIGDQALLGQMVLNLGLNAVESMSAGGRFVFALRKLRASTGHGPLVEIMVSDQGEGIARENLARIFDPFFSTRGMNRGLGLANSHAIAEAHGWLIRVESEPGQGTIIRVLLPA